MDTTTQRHKSNLPYIIVIGLVILALAFSWVASTLPSRHSLNKHGGIVFDVFNCLQNKGPYLGLKFRDRNGRWYLPCELKDGRIGLGIFLDNGDNVTSFVPRDGTWQQVKEYILQRATRINISLPFGFGP